MAERAWVVEVNEGAVEASSPAGANWWWKFRSRFEGTGGRLRQTKQPCVIGGVVEVACDDKEHAESLAATMVNVGKLPRGAVKVRRAAPAKATR